MALKFNETKGTAQKSVETYTYVNGDNTVRLVGGVLPRYVYWVPGTNNKNIPLECLAFSREEEKFNNKEKDHVQEYFPDIKCSWSYCINVIDPTDGKVKALNLKKKLFEQILIAAEDLGDPTDEETGWAIHFKRAKTGPLAFNVEYTLQVARCKPTPLTDEEKKLVAEADSIDVKYPRPTPEEVKNTLERITAGDSQEDSGENTAEKEAVDELK